MDIKEKRQYEKLALTPINKLITVMAIPTTISMMISMIYNLVDAYFVGRLGTSASASIGILLSVQPIFQALGFLLGHGSGTNISMRLGKGDREAADRFASTAFFTGLIISIIPAVLGLLFIEPLMKVLGSTPTILPYAKAYGTYILISGPALTLSCILNNIMRYEGKAVYAMVGLVSGGVLNMIGDPIFMFGFGMGINGAGLSTALSQYISLAILGYMFLSGKTISRITPTRISRDRMVLYHIFKNGLPSLIRQLLNSLSSMTLNICANPYGDAAIAAMAITGRIAMFIGSAMMGIGQGFQPVSSYNYSNQKYRRLRDAFSFTLKAGETVLGILALLCFIFPAQVITIFRDDPEVIEIGVVALRCQCIAIILTPISILSNMLFQSIGQSRLASFAATLRSGLYYIPLLLILPKLIGITGLEITSMIATILTTLTCLPLVILFFRKMPREDMATELDRKYQASLKQAD